MTSHAVAFDQAIADHLPCLRRRAARLTGTSHEADDVVQDALVRALRHRDQCRSAERARGWLLAIVSTTFLDRRRRRRARPTEVSMFVDAIAPTESADPAWSAFSVDDVRVAVADLPEHVRDAYRMFALEGCSYVAITAALGIPGGTVGSRVARARRLLRERLVAPR